MEQKNNVTFFEEPLRRAEQRLATEFAIAQSFRDLHSKIRAATSTIDRFPGPKAWQLMQGLTRTEDEADVQYAPTVFGLKQVAERLLQALEKDKIE